MSMHPVLRDAGAAMQTAIVYHGDPVASVLASRLISLEARYLDTHSLRRVYGWGWESVLGIFRLASDVTPDEEAVLSDRLTLRHRRLLAIGVKWLEGLGQAGIVTDVFEDADRLTRGSAERTRTALRAALVAAMLHHEAADDTPITPADEHELTIPIRAVLHGRGVSL